MASFALRMDHCLLLCVLFLFFLISSNSFVAAEQGVGYIGCYQDSDTNPALHADRKNPNGNVFSSKCRTFCQSYLFFALKNGSVCYCGSTNYGKYGKVDETACDVPCRGGYEICGGETTISVFRVTPCLEYCNNRTSNCTDSGTNKEITICNGCQENTTGSTCQECIDGFYGSGGTSCQACQCGIGAFNSTCDPSTGQCPCNSGFVGTSCSACASGKYLSGAACLDCGCGIGSQSQSCDTTTGQCPCKTGFVGRTCSACEDGKYLKNGSCIACGCDIGSSSTVCDKSTGQCPCNTYFGGLTCSTCQAGLTISGSACVDINECTSGTHNCSSNAICTNSFGGFTCTCKPGFSGNGYTCTDINECSLSLHNCSASATCTNTDGAFTCGCNSGFYGNGYSCSACNCGSGALSTVCNQLIGNCTCLPGFTSPTCSQCLPGRYGPSCALCPSCQHGTCNDLLAGNGKCTCGQGWTSNLCDTCAPGYFGPSCSGICPSCGQGSCAEGLLGNGTCLCQKGWKHNGAAFCSVCDDGYYLSEGQCLACHPSCQTCSNGSDTGCQSCSGSLFLDESSCVNLCPSGQYKDQILGCEPCASSCLECSGPSPQSCLQCPAGKVIEDGSCLDSCSAGLFNLMGTCQACHFQCATCSGPSEAECLSCPASTFLDPSAHKCLEQCPQQSFPDSSRVCTACHASCLTCSGGSNSNCLSCSPGMLLFGGQCVNECPGGFFNSSGICFACFDTCATCSEFGTDKCLTCHQDRNEKYLDGSICVTRCGSFRYAGPQNVCTDCNCNGWSSDCNSQDGTCYQCQNNTSGPHCDQCASGYWRNSTNLAVPCQKCECNQNSEQCQPITGVCLNCAGHTTGDHCETCLPNYSLTQSTSGFICTLTPTGTTHPTGASAHSTDPLVIGTGVGAAAVLVVIFAIILLVIRSRRSRNILLVGSELACKPISDPQYTTCHSFHLSASSTLQSIPTCPEAGCTMVNTEIGTELSLPAYLKVNHEEGIRIERSVAAGGGGSIFLGAIVDPELRSKYSSCADRIAIKKVFPREAMTDEENLLIFRQEVSVMSALSYHPNIARVLFFTEEPNTIVFPFYETDLHHLIHNPANVYSPIHIKEILYQISMGMQAVHALHIAHRDLKPANFLLEAIPGKEGFPYLVRITDFGVCSISHSAVTAQKFINVFGVSFRYAGPEVFSHIMIKTFDADFAELMKSDVYSFAITAWELITRQFPWEGLKTEEIQAKVLAGERPPLPNISNDPLLSVLQDLVRLCWSQEPTQRPSFREISPRLSRF